MRSLFLLLAGLLASAAPASATTPYLTAMSPLHAPAGSPDLALTISGLGFDTSSVAKWNGIALATKSVAANTMVVTAPASLLTQVGTANVTVENPGGLASNSYPFDVTSPPFVTSVTPTKVYAGAVDTYVAFSGGNFLWSPTVYYYTTNPAAAVPLTTSPLSPTLIDAFVPARFLTTPGSFFLLVKTAYGSATPVQIDVIAPPSVKPVLQSISPNSTFVGSGPVAITATGTGFDATQSLYIADPSAGNADTLVTTFVSSTTLKATIPLAYFYTPRNMIVHVVDPSRQALTADLPFTVYGPPIVSSVVTGSGATLFAGAAADTLVVSGSNFLQGATIYWDATPLSTTFQSSSKLTAPVPASLLQSSGHPNITVRNPTGLSSTDWKTFYVNPILTSISPTSAPPGAAKFVLTATGSGFVSTDKLLVGYPGGAIYLEATSVTSTSLTAPIPGTLLNTGTTLNVAVGDPAGPTSKVLQLPVVNSAPMLTGLSPASVAAGSAAFTLTLNGAGFLPGASVRWNSTVLSTTTVYASSLTVTVPASLIATAGTALVSVVNPDNAATAPMLFSIKAAVPPSVQSVTPNSFDAGGTAQVLTINGANFNSGSIANWGGTSLATSVTSSDQLTAIVPGNLTAVAGAFTVTVRNADGTASAGYTVRVLPVLSSVTPASVTAGGGTITVTATGIGFPPSAVVRMGIGTTVDLPTSYGGPAALSAKLPASAVASPGTLTIGVYDPPSGTASRTVALTVTAAPVVVASLSPASATAGGAAFTLTVNGSGFPAGAVVQWNGAALATTVVSATQLTASVSADRIAAPGTASVTVAAGGIVSAALSFAILKPEVVPPSIASLAPASAIAGAPGISLLVNGAGFLAGSTVRWNGSSLATSLRSATQLVADVPASAIVAAGRYSVTVANPDAAVSNAVEFAVLPSVPSVSAGGVLNAASSVPSIAPGSLISIYGSHLATDNAQASATPLGTALGGASVKINGVLAPLLFVSPVQINAQVPYEIPAGTARLVVESNGAASDAAEFQVTATAPGVIMIPLTTHALAINLADGSLNRADSPAKPGDYIMAYVIGQGLVDHPVATGAAAAAEPLALPVAAVAVKIGGIPAEVQFAGLAPGFVGLMQLNVRIPEIADGEQGLEVTIGGSAANATTLSIRR